MTENDGKLIPYILGLNFLTFLIYSSQIFEIFFFLTTIPWTDTILTPNQLTNIYNGINSALLSQNDYLGFNYWFYTSNILRIIGYVIPEYFFMSNPRSKIYFVVCLVSYTITILIDFLKLGYNVFIISSCGEYVVCRGRTYISGPSIQFWYVFISGIAYIPIAVIILIVNTLLIVSIKEIDKKMASKLVSSKIGFGKMKKMKEKDVIEYYNLSFFGKLKKVLIYITNKIFYF